MNEIHPTAVIGSGVRMGEGNVIGPFAVIAGSVVIGSNNWIGSGVRIGVPPEVRDFEHVADWIENIRRVGVVIGSDNVLREGVQVHGGWKENTVLGDDLFVMNRTYIAHDCQLSNGVTLASGVALGGHVHVGRLANIGLGTTVHQRRVVGALTMVGMSSVVTKDVPPFVKSYGNPCRVHGVNAIGMERAGIDARTIAELKRALKDGDYPADLGDMGVLAEDFAWFTEAVKA